MAEQDSAETFPRMFEGVEAFVSKFTTNRLHIKKEGQSIELKSPFDGKKTNLATLIGYLVAHYVRFSDAENLAKKNLRTDSDQFLIPYQEGHLKRFKVAMYLSQTITYAYAFNLVEEDEANEELYALRKKNTELTQDIVDLRSKLETRQKNYEGLKKRVSWDEHKDNKGVLGDVSA